MKLHIYGALKSYEKRSPLRLHMPGHKASRRFAPFAGAALDITELPFADCLESPSGIIARAQTDIADILGAKRSHILTDGSTCGIYAMLHAVRGRGSKVIVARNSHKSVYNACAVLGLEPVPIRNNEREGVLLPPTAADVEAALRKEEDVCAVLITSPDYFGNAADLAAIKKVCRGREKPLLADGAHGAYLRFDPDESDIYAGRHADIWVDGSHKTMPTLTQGALLNVNDLSLEDAAEEGLQLFRTTSPSYPVMASVEYGVKYMEEKGAELIDELRRELALVKAQLKKRGIPYYEDSRTLVLAVDFAAAGISPALAAEALARRNVFSELCDARYVLFYFSPFTTPAQLGRMEGAVRAVFRQRELRNTAGKAPHFACGVKKLGYLTALSFAHEYVPLAEAAGRVAARNAGITPPCWPVLVAGEQITAEAAEALEHAPHTFGVRGGKVAVVKLGGRKG